MTVLSTTTARERDERHDTALVQAVAAATAMAGRTRRRTPLDLWEALRLPLEEPLAGG